MSSATKSPKTGVDDYLAGGGTVAELLLMARPYEPQDTARERLSRDEMLRASTGELWAHWRRMPTVKQGELTDRNLARELIRRAERNGKVVSDGLYVVASVRTLALAIGVGTRALHNSLGRLDASGFLRRDYAGRARDQAGAYVLITKNALGKHNGKETGVEGEKVKNREGGEEGTSLSHASSDRGVSLAQHDARPMKSAVPELRYSRSVVSWERDKRGRRRQVVEPLKRLGKKRQAILEHLEERGGVCTVAELMARFAGKRTRPYDFKRRTLAMLTESPAVVVVEGDIVSLAGNWRESLEQAREIAGEQEAARLQAAKYERNRKAFHQRDQVAPEPIPDMTPIPDMRTPWPVHPDGCACPSCEKRMGRVIGEHVEGCCCATCFTARKAKDGGRLVPTLREVEPEPPRETEAETRAVVVSIGTKLKRPPMVDGIYQHDAFCGCEWCDTPLAPRYATPRSTSL